MNNFVEKVGGYISTTVGRTGLKIQKYSPELLVIGGVVGFGVAAGLACKASFNAPEIMEEAKEDISKIKEDKDYKDDDEAKKDLAKVYFHTGKELFKIYWPAITLGAVSATAILSGHNILRKRNLAMAAAYKSLETSFDAYRKRVISEFGEDIDRRLKNGIEEKEWKVEDESGKQKKIKADFADPNNISKYARFFDASCPQWHKDPTNNLFFLKSQQQYATDLLRSRGHIFLNEVYDLLGFDRTKEGAVVGWVLGAGDDFVDFGIYDQCKVANRNFVNGFEDVILLDFNVDGLIYDKI